MNKIELNMIDDITGDYKNIINNIQSTLEKYLINSGLQSLVIGVSGGIDSAICCALASPVCQKLDISLIGRFIQIESNKKDEEVRANNIAWFFCDNYESIDLTDTYKSILPIFDNNNFLNSEEENSMAKKIRHGNIKARLRMIYLYDLAQKNKGMVLSTDNLTEYYLGFWTLHGDVGNYGMIQNLWKTEVYQLSRSYADIFLDDNQAKKALLDCVDAVPTDGLGITNSDLDQIGISTYNEVDKIILRYLKNPDCIFTNSELKVIDRIKKSNFKRLDPQSINREILLKNV
jgi:NAD+ synthetase